MADVIVERLTTWGVGLAFAAEDDAGRASALLDTYVSHEERPEGQSPAQGV